MTVANTAVYRQFAHNILSLGSQVFANQIDMMLDIRHRTQVVREALVEFRLVVWKSIRENLQHPCLSRSVSVGAQDLAPELGKNN